VCWIAGNGTLQGLESDPQSLGEPSSTGSPSSGWSRPIVSVIALEWDDSRLAALDLQYHDLRPSKSLFCTARDGRGSPTTRRWPAQPSSRRATTRAYFRGRCLERFSSAIVAANWDSVLFDIGEEHAASCADDGAAARHGRSMSIRSWRDATLPASLLRRLGFIRNGDGRARAEEATDGRAGK